MTSQPQQKNTGLIVLAVVLIVALIGAVVFLAIRNNEKDDDLKAMEEMAAFEKEQLQDEYETLAMQFDGYNMNISNDSLADLLSKEQQRVRDLLEELRVTKATDARRISELKKELATVREVMKGYVAQIDSLNKQNQILAAENQQVKQQYNEVSEQARGLREERDQLTEVVTRASMMEVINFSYKGLNNRGREKKHIRNITTLEFDYAIQKNITVTPGIKTIYLQIRQPNGEVLVKNSSDTFEFEGKQIPFSIEKEFEYTGELLSDVMYWTVEEVLEEGTYNADFFIDGNLCGSFMFEMKK